MTDILDEAIETYRRIRFLNEVNAGYAALRGDRNADAAFREGMAELDGTLLDGLAHDKPASVGRPLRIRRKITKR